VQAALAPRTTPGRRLLAVCAGSVTALAFLAAAGARAHSLEHFALLAGFGLLLVALGSCDLATLLLPNRLMYPGLLAGLLLCWAWPGHSAASSLAGGALGGLLMLAAFVLMPGFGGGDVKLCALIGLLVGVGGVLTALMLGIVINGGAVLLGLATRRLKLRGVVPYGPGLVLGALLLLLRAAR
jgi:leader peptidase (prepilin peptidase) / N-methyltransferase